MAASGLRARLGRTFLLQAAFISVAAIIGVFLASVVLEGVLIRQALREEAAHFWAERSRDPAFPLPGTVNLTGYLDDPPADLAGLAPGYHERTAQALYSDVDREAHDLVPFKDGRLLARSTGPHRLEGRVVGRIWIFRDASPQRRVTRLT